MKPAALVCFFYLAATFSLFAEDWTATDGKVYKNVKVISHDAATVTILFDDGGAKLPISSFSIEVQKELGFDVSKAEAQLSKDRSAATADAAAAQKAHTQAGVRKELLASSKIISGNIVYVGNGYIEVECARPDPPQIDAMEAEGGTYANVSSPKEVNDAFAKQTAGYAYGVIIVRDDPSADNRAVGDAVTIKGYPCGTSVDAFGEVHHAYTAKLP